MTDAEFDKLEPAATKLKAIAHPHRIAILGYLNENERLSVTDIYQRLNVHQAVASQHLKLLRTNGLISGRRSGKNTYYTINRENLRELMQYFFLQ